MGEGELRDIALRLHAASARLLRDLRRDDDSGLSTSRFSALSSIALHGPLSLGGLAEAEQVRPPTMSRIVDFLVDEGLATRETRPGDRRSIVIRTTERGTALMEAARQQRVRQLSARLTRLADSEIRALSRGIEVLDRISR